MENIKAPSHFKISEEVEKRMYQDTFRLLDTNVFGRFCEDMRKCNDTDLLEVENYSFRINPLSQYFYLCSPANDESYFSKNKACALMDWYLNGDRDDLSILKAFPEYEYPNIDDDNFIQINESTRQVFPKFNSNYGYYLFTQGFLFKAYEKLKANKNSRQASISINSNQVMYDQSIDKLCTNNIMFRIRDNKLNMTVQMRSNDLIRNMVYDVFTFSLIYGIMFNSLTFTYPELGVGEYYHTSASMHIHKSDIDKLMYAMKAESQIRPCFKLRLNFYDPYYLDKLKAKVAKITNLTFNV